MLLAPAHRRFSGARALPQGLPVTVVHGVRDDVVDIADSRDLVNAVVEVDDDHRLQRLIDGGRLGELVRTTFERHR